MIKLLLCKRGMYVKAWQVMYASNKKGFNTEMFDGVNPMLNKVPLKTELDNICVVAVDVRDDVSEDVKKDFGGMPVGIHSMLVTRTLGRNGAEGSVKVIGKQWVVAPDMQKRGIGKAMLIALERELADAGYTWYYIGCSSMSSRIMHDMGRKEFTGSEEHDLYKFNVDLDGEMANNALNALDSYEWCIDSMDISLLRNPEAPAEEVQ